MAVECLDDRGRSLAARFWIYQRERFPLLVHGAVIAALSASALGVPLCLPVRAR